jgi:hypothetical protein
LILRRFEAVSVEMVHGVAEVAAVPSKDRVAHLSISESSPARWAADLDEWRHDLAKDVARPSRVGDRSNKGWRLSSGGGMAGTCEGSSAPSSVGAANRTVSPRMFRGIRLDPTKVRGELRRDRARIAGVAAVPSEDRVAHLSISESSPASGLPISTSGDTDPAGDVSLPSRDSDRSHKVWRLSSAEVGGHPARVAPHPLSVGGANRTVSPRMFRGIRLGPTKVRGELCRDYRGR